MTSLVSISSERAEPVHPRSAEIFSVPVVVIALHEGCDCRCVMCDIWKIQSPRELAFENLERQLDSFEKLGVRWVALTGGEPQRHSHFSDFTAALRARNIRVTMLTAGVLLEPDVEVIAAAVDDVIVSLDGPPEIHDRIRRVPDAFTRLAGGIHAIKRINPGIPLSGRCTVQRGNHDALCRTVECAKQMGLTSISFLAADLTSRAFNRATTWSVGRQSAVALTETQADRLEQEIECLIVAHGDRGFVVESPDKLRRILLHFRAHLGQRPAIAPRCNAPWVSAVIEASGEVRPCFFHPAIGSIHEMTFSEVINSPQALHFRSDLDIAGNPTCRRCVCSLFLPPSRRAGNSHSTPASAQATR